ncbi:MAG TPA: hypothetical protein PKN11_06410 [Anaerolineaceae bacterium]|nr:hypothetical protein [Anaerolineaceae bacterium]
MPKIRCRYIDCGFLDEGYCSAALVEMDPDQGCLTYAPTAEIIPEDDWDEEEAEEEWEELEEEEEEDDLRLDDEDDSED